MLPKAWALWGFCGKEHLGSCIRVESKMQTRILLWGFCGKEHLGSCTRVESKMQTRILLDHETSTPLVFVKGLARNNGFTDKMHVSQESMTTKQVLFFFVLHSWCLECGMGTIQMSASMGLRLQASGFRDGLILIRVNVKALVTGSFTK